MTPGENTEGFQPSVVYYDARGSVGEVESQTITACDLNFMNKEDFEKIFSQAEKVGVILGGLIRSTENLSKK